MTTSGIRLGTPAGTSRGFGAAEFEQIGRWIADIAKDPTNQDLLAETRNEVVALTSRFPVPA
jgi:glycine hydroxymethyltransferase